jgi:hypothetical protein
MAFGFTARTDDEKVTIFSPSLQSQKLADLERFLKADDGGDQWPVCSSHLKILSCAKS